MGRREAPYKRFAAGKTLAEAEFSSAEHKMKKGPRRIEDFAGVPGLD